MKYVIPAGFILVFIGGIGIGMYAVPAGLKQLNVLIEKIQNGSKSEGGHSHEEAETNTEHPDEKAHVDIAESVIKSMGIRIKPVSVKPYVVEHEVPAMVTELPGLSDLYISTKIEGVVSEIFVVPGQAIKQGDKLFEIELTGDALASAQSSLLDALLQLEIIDDEIKRLKPLVAEGGIASKNLLKLEYDKKRMIAQKKTKTQELLVRGLTEKQIKEIITQKQLIKKLTIYVPENILSGLPTSESSKSEATANVSPLSLEELHVAPGSLIKIGDRLCDLAYHSHLWIEGYAYEKDLQVIRNLMKTETALSIELGPDDNPYFLKSKIIHLDNHVDAKSNAYRFYTVVQNKKLGETQDTYKRKFFTWQYKPGQRGHIHFPVRTIENEIPLPAEAVITEGLESFVFIRSAVAHQDHGAEDPAHDNEEHEDHAHEHFLEFQPIPVKVIHKDRRSVVVSSEGELKPEMVIAYSHAFLLHQQMMNASGGGGHHHHHDH